MACRVVSPIGLLSRLAVGYFEPPTPFYILYFFFLSFCITVILGAFFNGIDMRGMGVFIFLMI